jgi:hypothetical protein
VSASNIGETANVPDYAIDVEGLGVRYNLRLTRQTTVRTSFRDLLKKREGPSHFWALRDVSFRVVHGESLAVIGPNGAGKSTLLQVLAGIIQPNEGSVDVVGHISSLLTLGAGFDGDLSGRDNIRLAAPSSASRTGSWRSGCPGSSTSPTSASSSTPRSRRTPRACGPGSASRSRPPSILTS